MPTYVYEVLDEQGNGTGECFEVVQRMSEDALTKHPESGKPVRRIPQAPTIPGKWSDAGMKQGVSDSRLNELGFTKYQKTSDGNYEKTAGKGPSFIDRNNI
ncbi:MAG: FmdB family transcriptional regulator [Planctomycetota bacterium]